ncbi:Pescadillo N-terminus-domain-containing protein [Baffinella frigidus]|nr:Pescadillo N-terminus-domain-containing protein [Cryptophyta sp. CCMP2293]
MVRIAKKAGKSGDAVNYITRNMAIKKLQQVSLADFRRLCILKGCYPRDPKKKVKGKDKTYYANKDILFLLHEPVLEKLRLIRAHNRKIAKARKDTFRATKLSERKPFYVLDHLVKERFPSFVDAIRDMDDALCLATLFATLPGTDTIESARSKNARRLILEFSNYVVRARALTKVFFSIKGCYLQAKVQGQDVTWLVPYEFGQNLPEDVDYRVMMTFLEFYETQLHFINFKLYSSLGLNARDPQILNPETRNPESPTASTPRSSSRYPSNPQTLHHGAGANKIKSQEKARVRAQALPRTLEREGAGADKTEGGEQDLDQVPPHALPPTPYADMGVDGGEDEEEVGGKEETLLCDLKFFLSREVPRALMELMIRAFGGAVGWEGEGSPFGEADKDITHQVVDRDSQRHQFLSREYVQPQWVADCINAEILLPVSLEPSREIQKNPDGALATP